MQLPAELRAKLEELTAEVPASELQRAAQEISDAYRERRFASPVMRTAAHRIAYLNARMPATYAANAHVFKEVADRIPSLPSSILDLGAGPGTATLAANSFFSFNESVCMEADSELRKLGERLLPQSKWFVRDLESATELEKHDLVVLSYSLGELKDKTQVVAKAWNAANIALVIIEPGTPQGFANVLAAREQLIAAGANIIAPCPHHGRCGLALRGDWCHFSERLERTSLHRRMKGGELGHEDEKFSYVVACRPPASRAQSRIVRHPMKHSGHIQLTLCLPPENIEQRTITRSQKAVYKAARRAEWGDAWHPENQPPEIPESSPDE
jgi:ribosomal protein RSM22 (predicted rRNA methylase)